MTLPWPEYSEVAGRLFDAFSEPAWQDYGYLSHDTDARLAQPGLIENATLNELNELNELKSLMTFCVRGERFFGSHWGGMIEAGYVERILRRLAVVRRDGHRARRSGEFGCPDTTQRRSMQCAAANIERRCRRQQRAAGTGL